MDIKLSIKGLSVIRGQIKAESMDVGFSCTEGETANCNECSLELLNNPAVQGLIRKFTNEVNFAPAQSANHQPKTADNTISELCKRIDALSASLKKEREANARIRQTEREIINSLNRRMAEVAERNKF